MLQKIRCDICGKPLFEVDGEIKIQDIDPNATEHLIQKQIDHYESTGYKWCMSNLAGKIAYYKRIKIFRSYGARIVNDEAKFYCYSCYMGANEEKKYEE